MSTGGNVPAQGTVVEEATTAKRRGSRGELGKGTRGDRVKSAWRNAMKLAGAPKNMTSLRQYVRDVIRGRRAPGHEVGEELLEEFKGWLDVKTHVRTAAKKKAMKEAKSKKRAKPKKPSKDRRRVKGNSGKR